MDDRIDLKKCGRCDGDGCQRFVVQALGGGDEEITVECMTCSGWGYVPAGGFEI